MAGRLSTWIKKKIVRKDQNLVSLEEPYDKVRRLLEGHSVANILDAGASRGHISERMLGKFPQAHVWAFEPNPMYRQVLESYASRENRFHPFFAALSDHAGTAELNITESAGNTSLLRPTDRLSTIDPVGAAVRQKVSVPIMTIDDWARQNKVDGVQLMKFDIQGYELAALKGAVQTLRTSTLAIYTEVWFNSVYENGAILSDLDLFLREHGFVLYDLFKPRYNKAGLIQWANTVFVHADRLKV